MNTEYLKFGRDLQWSRQGKESEGTFASAEKFFEPHFVPTPPKTRIEGVRFVNFSHYLFMEKAF